MTATHTTPGTPPALVYASPEVLPDWVGRLMSAATTRARRRMDDTIEVSRCTTDALTLVTVRLRDAGALSAERFEARVRTVYHALRDTLDAGEHRRPLRVWNVIPDIHRREADGRDRYMVFNAARFAAYESWWHADPRRTGALPTASAVGTRDADLVVHVLAGARAGIPVENPRQRPAYEYSKRFGPLPPCFARMTLLPPTEGHGESTAAWPSPHGWATMLVGGTASVRGEASQFVGDARAQARETRVNLVSLIEAGVDQLGDNGCQVQLPENPLAAFRQLRVYLSEPASWSVVRTEIDGRFPAVSRIELVEVDLCRDDLVVEIEGFAEVAVGEPGLRR